MREEETLGGTYQTIKAKRDASVRRGAHLKGVQQEAELLLGLFLAHPDGIKHLGGRHSTPHNYQASPQRRFSNKSKWLCLFTANIMSQDSQ